MRYKHRLQKLFVKFGYSLIRSSSLTTTESFYRRIKAKGIKTNVVFDIGAHKGNFSKNISKILTTSEFYMFEANPTHQPSLEKSKFPYFISLLSDRIEEKYFYKIDGTGDSYYLENYTKNYFNVTPQIMLSQTLDQIVEIHKLPQPNILKLDVQGSEIDVLKGGLVTVKNADLITLEMPVVEYNKQSPDFVAIIKFMKSINFIPIDIVEIHSSKDGLFQIDIAFLRTDLINLTQMNTKMFSSLA